MNRARWQARLDGGGRVCIGIARPVRPRSAAVEVVVQVDGTARYRLTVPADLPEEQARELALASPKVREDLDGKEPAKVIYVPGRLVNMVR